MLSGITFKGRLCSIFISINDVFIYTVLSIIKKCIINMFMYKDRCVPIWFSCMEDGLIFCGKWASKSTPFVLSTLTLNCEVSSACLCESILYIVLCFKKQKNHQNAELLRIKLSAYGKKLISDNLFSRCHGIINLNWIVGRRN